MKILKPILFLTFFSIVFTQCSMMNKQNNNDSQEQAAAGLLLLQSLNPERCISYVTKDHANQDLSLALSGDLVCDGNIIRGSGSIRAPENDLANASFRFKLLGDDSEVIFYGSTNPDQVSTGWIGFRIKPNETKLVNNKDNRSKDVSENLKAEKEREYAVCLEIHYHNCNPHLLAGPLGQLCGDPRTRQPNHVVDEKDFGSCGGNARGFIIKNAEIIIEKMYAKPNPVWPHG